MSRTPKLKTLENTKLASGHGGWIYCAACGENIGNLCYVTYDNFRFSYECNCGAHGAMHLAFEDTEALPVSEKPLILIRNRLCCPSDSTPLFTVLQKKLRRYAYEVVCTECKQKYAYTSDGVDAMCYNKAEK